jgi:hypothetical protein
MLARPASPAAIRRLIELISSDGFIGSANCRQLETPVRTLRHKRPRRQNPRVRSLLSLVSHPKRNPRSESSRKGWGPFRVAASRKARRKRLRRGRGSRAPRSTLLVASPRQHPRNPKSGAQRQPQARRRHTSSASELPATPTVGTASARDRKAASKEDPRGGRGSRAERSPAAVGAIATKRLPFSWLLPPASRACVRRSTNDLEMSRSVIIYMLWVIILGGQAWA